MPTAAPANFWDIIGSIGDFIGGIGTAGALIVAVVVYRRQVDDARRDQASKIIVSIQPPLQVPPKSVYYLKAGRDVRMVKALSHTISVTNAGLNNVRDVLLELFYWDTNENMFRLATELSGTLNPGATLRRQTPEAYLVQYVVKFYDGTGRRWVRDYRGALYQPKVKDTYREFDEPQMIHRGGQ